VAKETTFDHPPKGHVAILAYDSANDQWQAVYVDASGNLQVDVASGNQIEALAHGYYGGGWQKNPLQFGFSDRLADGFYNGDLAAGYSEFTKGTVPVGEVYVVTWCTLAYYNSVPTRVELAGMFGTFGVDLINVSSPADGVTYTRLVNAFLKAGDYFRLRIYGATLHDIVYVKWHGYKMDVDL
jgi:hypothetical protein